MFTSIRRRLTLIFPSLAIVPSLLIGMIIALHSFTNLEQQSLALQQEVAKRVSGEIKAFLRQREHELALLDVLHGFTTRPLSEQRTLLNTLLLTHPAYQEFVILNAQGQEIIRLSRTDITVHDTLKSRSAAEEFLFPTTQGKTYFGPVRFDETLREPVLTLALPFFDLRSGRVASILLAELRFKAIWEVLAALDLSPQTDVYVTDYTGRIVAHKNPAVVLRGTRIDVPETESRVQGLSGTEVIVAQDILQLGQRELIVFAEQDVSSALSLAIDCLRTTMFVTVITLLGAAVLVWLTTRQVVVPIEALATAVRAIGHGDFSIRVDEFRRDEVGQLASAFNQMTRDLEKSRQQIAQYTLDLEAKNEQYHTLVETIPHGIEECNVSGLITFSNGTYATMFGYTEGELKGKAIWDMLASERERDDLQAYFAKLVQDQPLPTPYLSQIRTKNGRVIDVQVDWNYKRDVQGRVVGFVSVISDITERKRLEQELLTISEREQRRIGQDLHDGLGQHLTGTVLLCKGVERQLAAQSLPETEQVTRIADLVNQAIIQTRDLARGLYPVDLEIGGLVIALQTLSSNVETLFDIRCQIIGEPFLPLPSATVAIHLYRIAQEAVQNAARHGHAKQVTLTLSTEANCFTLVVHDDGTGFPDTVSEGQGMGLRIMRYRARLIGATLEVQSSKADGTRVTCTVPRAVHPSPRRASPSPHFSKAHPYVISNS